MIPFFNANFLNWLKENNIKPEKPEDFVVGLPKDNPDDYKYLEDYIATFINFLGPTNGGSGTYDYIDMDSILKNCTMFIASWKYDVLVYLSIHFDSNCVAMSVLQNKYASDLEYHTAGVRSMIYAMSTYPHQWRQWVVQSVDDKHIPLFRKHFNGFTLPESLAKSMRYIDEVDGSDYRPYLFRSDKDYRTYIDSMKVFPENAEPEYSELNLKDKQCRDIRSIPLESLQKIYDVGNETVRQLILENVPKYIIEADLTKVRDYKGNMYYRYKNKECYSYLIRKAKSLKYLFEIKEEFMWRPMYNHLLDVPDDETVIVFVEDTDHYNEIYAAGFGILDKRKTV